MLPQVSELVMDLKDEVREVAIDWICATPVVARSFAFFIVASTSSPKTPLFIRDAIVMFHTKDILSIATLIPSANPPNFSNNLTTANPAIPPTTNIGLSIAALVMLNMPKAIAFSLDAANTVRNAVPVATIPTITFLNFWKDSVFSFIAFDIGVRTLESPLKVSVIAFTRPMPFPIASKNSSKFVVMLLIAAVIPFACSVIAPANWTFPIPSRYFCMSLALFFTTVVTPWKV